MSLLSKKSFKKFNLAIAFFIAFAGFYVVLMVMAQIGLIQASRVMTIPMRIVIVACLGIVFLLRPKIKIQKGLFFFLLFSFFYYSRIFIEYLDTTSSFYIPEVEFFLYFTSFALLPIFFISQYKLDDEDFTLVFYSIIIGCLLFSILSYTYYNNIIGSSARFSDIQLGIQVLISPFAFSYTSVLGMGIGISYLLTNKVRGIRKTVIYATLGLCLIPFFLGASRGSVLALIFPFIFYFIFSKGVKRKATIIYSLLGVIIILGIATIYFGDTVFNRFFNILNVIESGGETSIRLVMWRLSWLQFLQAPLFGNSLELIEFNFYPHNILLEALITTGVLGFIPFVLFLFYTLKRSVEIIRNNPSHLFIVVIFIQALTKHMFSGSIYSISWLAIGAGLIIGYNKHRTISRSFTE